MASTPTFQSNPYADFDPSQWANPYSNFQNSAIPFPATYSGWPTDALGNPIAKPPGMTLNSAPAAAQPPPAAAPMPSAPLAGPAQPGGMGLGMNGVNPQIATAPAFGGSQYAGSQYAPQATPYMGPAPQQAAVAPMPAPQANPAGLTSQQYLQLRANPGRVTTPGATVPQSPPPGGSNGVLQQFLANWNPAQSGPGSGFQQAFAKALKGS